MTGMQGNTSNSTLTARADFRSSMTLQEGVMVEPVSSPLTEGTIAPPTVDSWRPPPDSPPRARVLWKYSACEEHILPKVTQQYSSCLTRKDLLSRMQDGPPSVKPKPPSEPVKVWPPEDYDHTFRPPKLEKLPLPFSVSSYPGLVKETYESFLTFWKDYLELPLTDDEKARWIEMEVHRLDQFSGLALRWMDYDTVVTRLDDMMYRSVLEFFARVIPFRTDVDNIPGTTHSIELEQRDWVVLALGYKKIQPSCLVRLLHMTNLDVCAEIQDIALQSPAVKLEEGQPQWSKLETLTPQHGKAKSILEWVFHATRPHKSIHEGSCNFIKLGDGWNTIWFYVDKGVIQVGPTMTPYITDEPGPNAQIGLTHILLACASKAGRDHHRHNRLLLQSLNQTEVTGVATSSSSSTAKVTGELSREMRRRKIFKGSSTNPSSSTRQSPRERHATIRFPLDQHTHKSVYADSRDETLDEANAHVKKKARSWA